MRICIDLLRDTFVATFKGKDITTQTKTFGTYTGDLYQLNGWLQNHGVTHVAMVNTGVHWKLVYYILEEFFEIILVNARYIKNIPGQKTDKKDSEWIAKLLLSGLHKDIIKWQSKTASSVYTTIDLNGL